MHISPNTDIPHGVLGGLIIGLSSSAMLYYTGKITGISGTVEGVMVSDAGNSKFWTLPYIGGLLTSGVILANTYPEAFGTDPQLFALSPFGYATAGLLTGFGTRLGSGCTSGHGICGLPRRSVRSLAAVMSFMCTGALSAYLTAHTPVGEIFRGSVESFESTGASDHVIFYITPTVLMTVFGATLFNRNFILNKVAFGDDDSIDSTDKKEPVDSPMKYAVAFSSAVVFGLGLGVSGMCDTARVTGFLDFTSNSGWDLTLLGVMGGGVLFNLITFHLMNGNNHIIPLDPISKISSKIKMDFHPDNLKIDGKLIIGSALFGLGWGLGNFIPDTSCRPLLHHAISVTCHQFSFYRFLIASF